MLVEWYSYYTRVAISGRVADSKAESGCTLADGDPYGVRTSRETSSLVGNRGLMAAYPHASPLTTAPVEQVGAGARVVAVG